MSSFLSKSPGCPVSCRCHQGVQFPIQVTSAYGYQRLQFPVKSHVFLFTSFQFKTISSHRYFQLSVPCCSQFSVTNISSFLFKKLCFQFLFQVTRVYSAHVSRVSNFLFQVTSVYGYQYLQFPVKSHVFLFSSFLFQSMSGQHFPVSCSSN